MKKNVISMILIGTLVLALTGCGKPAEPETSEKPETRPVSEEAEKESEEDKAPEADKTYKIALLEKGAEDFFLSIDQGFMDACEEYGVEGTVVAPSTYHDSAQINNAMAQIISTGYDAVVMCPQDYDANASAIDEAYNAGLPVICLDSLTASDNYIASICTDNVAAGAQAADKMAELLGDEGGKIAVFANDPQAVSDVDRVQGFMDRCKEKYPNIECMDVQYYNNDLNRCSTQVSDTLTANPDLAGLFCVNNQSTLAAGNDLVSYQKESLKFVGFDSDQDEIALMKSGVVDALMVQEPYQMGYLGLKNMLAYLQGEEVSKENIDPGCKVVTLENLDELEE